MAKKRKNPHNFDTVVIVCDSAVIDGGLAKVAITSALTLAARGLQVIYFCPTQGADPALAAAGIKVVGGTQLPVSLDPNKGRAMIRGLWNKPAADDLRAVLSDLDLKRTIIHCHGYSKALSPAIGPVITATGCRTVWTMHEYFLSCPNGGFFDFPRRQICTRKPLGLACLTTNCDSRHAVHKVWRVTRQAILHSAGKLPRSLRDVIYISDSQRRVMTPAFPQTTRFHHVRNPVEMGNAERVTVEDNDAFVFVGRLASDKGAVEFARAAKQAGVRAVFVGSGNEDAAIKEANPDAELVGWQDAAGVKKHLTSARCLVFPSLWFETYGLVAFEALKMGVPVILGRWNAACEEMSDGQDGLFYNTTDDLAETLRKMTPETAGRMSHYAYGRRDMYGSSPDEHADRLIEVYQTLEMPAVL